MTVTVRSFAKINSGFASARCGRMGFTICAPFIRHCFARHHSRAGGTRHGHRDSLRRPACSQRRIEYLLSHCGAGHGSASGPRARDITIEKRLPVQGGLGAGSGNAVAALLALERALKKKAVGSGEAANRGARSGRICRCFWWAGRCWEWGMGRRFIRCRICRLCHAWWRRRRLGFRRPGRLRIGMR